MMMPRLAFSARTRRSAATTVLSQRLSSKINSAAMYLHVGPSGDCWTGASIYAAKHLQPDYVKSIPLPPHVCVESLLERLEDDLKLTQGVYDSAELPNDLIEEMKVQASTRP